MTERASRVDLPAARQGRRLRPGAVLVVLLAGSAPGSATAAPTVADLAWLAGCWASVGGEAGSGELWTAPAGGSMLGVGRVVQGGRTVFYEFLRIAEVEPGRIAYFAQVPGQPEVAFALARATGDEVVFENPGHDFPQRIVYRRESADRIRARVEGLRGGQPAGEDFPLARCAPSP